MSNKSEFFLNLYARYAAEIPNVCDSILKLVIREQRERELMIDFFKLDNFMADL